MPQHGRGPRGGRELGGEMMRANRKYLAHLRSITKKLSRAGVETVQPISAHHDKRNLGAD